MEPTASLHYASVDGNASPSAVVISKNSCSLYWQCECISSKAEWLLLGKVSGLQPQVASPIEISIPSRASTASENLSWHNFSMR
jgi:hypothetical protein